MDNEIKEEVQEVKSSKKARGYYSKLSKENQEYYEKVMDISFTSKLEKFTLKELAYLSDLYEQKFNEIKKSNPEELNSKQLLTIIISLKLKTVVSKRNINLLKYRYGINRLSYEKMAVARTKLNNVFKEYRI